MPTSGKTHLLESVKDTYGWNVYSGSELLKKLAPNFSDLDKEKKKAVRVQLANELMRTDDFLMDGHYAFETEKVFTEEDGSLYDAFVYLYVAPEILHERLVLSEKNQAFAKKTVSELTKWQTAEINGLRKYCHDHDKDFYICDDPENGYCKDETPVLNFLNVIRNGYSCVSYAKECREAIETGISGYIVSLADGDKTVIEEDSTAMFGYRTHIFDGNFYTGYQAWRHFDLWERYKIDHPEINAASVPETIHIRQTVLNALREQSGAILTSGNLSFWERFGKQYRILVFGGAEMSADTKFFIAKFLKSAAYHVNAYGDSRNDYDMLLEADEGFFIARPDRSISRSLNGCDLSRIRIVLEYNILTDTKRGPFILPVTEEIEKLIAITKSDSGVSGPALVSAHRELGRRIAPYLPVTDPKDTTVVSVLRGGQFFAEGIYEELGCRFEMYNPKLETFKRPDTKQVILVDSVINTGKTISPIVKDGMIVACCVASEEAAKLFGEQLYAVRISKNSYVGTDVKVQHGNVGPDTTMRLFNQI